MSAFKAFGSKKDKQHAGAHTKAESTEQVSQSAADTAEAARAAAEERLAAARAALEQARAKKAAAEKAAGVSTQETAEVAATAAATIPPQVVELTAATTAPEPEAAPVFEYAPETIQSFEPATSTAAEEASQSVAPQAEEGQSGFEHFYYPDPEAAPEPQATREAVSVPEPEVIPTTEPVAEAPSISADASEPTPEAETLPEPEPEPVQEAVEPVKGQEATTPEDEAAQTEELVAIDDADSAELAAATIAALGEEIPKRRPKLPLILAAVLVALLLVGGGIGAYMHAQKVDYDAHQPHPIVFALNAEGLDGDDSGIPVRIEGSDMDGNQIETDILVDATGNGIPLVRGTYTATVKASPLTSDGIVYNIPAEPISFAIPEEIETSAVFTPADAITLTPIAATEVTDEQITAAYDEAVSSGLDRESAQKFKAAALKARDDAKKKAKEDAENKKLEADLKSSNESYEKLIEKLKNDTYKDANCLDFDVDGDGTKELLVNNAPDSLRVFCYDKNAKNMTVAISFNPGDADNAPIYYDLKGNQVGFYSADDKREVYEFYKLENGKGKLTARYTHEFSADSESWTADGADITLDDYNSGIDAALVEGSQLDPKG